MSTLRAGDIVAVKATGEYVYLTGKQFDNGQFEVHRPKLTRDGIVFGYDGFEAGELETVEEHVERGVQYKFLELEAQKRIMEAKMKALENQPDEPETKDYSVN